MFHWKDGWFFQRAEGGGVEILKRRESSDNSPIVSQAVIPENEWRPRWTPISKDGETYERWIQIKNFHGRETND